MTVDPSQHRILLVGPRVVHLKPFFERRRYNCVAVQKGVEGMTALDAEPRDIVILELNLGDLTATEFLMAARQAHAQASFLLLDDASKAGQIVKALQAGLDGYLPTPPDEDRLFFEVERHLRNSGGGGNGLNTGETQLAMRGPGDTTALQTQLADRESQLVELGMQNDLLQQEVTKARDSAKLFQSVKGALVGVLDGDLDEDAAVRLKERLAMATVLETEVETLREELAAAKNLRRELQEQVDALKKKVGGLEERVDQKNMDSLEGAALRDRATELESENMVLEGRVAELEEDLDLAKAEVVALEQKYKAERHDLQRDLNRLSSDQALSQGSVEKAAADAAATVARLRSEHSDALDKLRETHKDDIARLKEQHEADLKNAVSDVEIERATVADRIRDAVAAERKKITDEAAAERKRITEEAGGTKGALEQQLQQALADREQAVEKALDIELLLDELKTKIDYLEGEVQKEKERATRAEESFKKDKLRLIEEKEVAASGSGEAFNKVQKYLDENAALRRTNAELEAMRKKLEDKARAGDEAVANAALELENATRIRADALTQKDVAEAAKRAIEERNAIVEKRAAQLEKTLEEERQRLLAAERALGDTGNLTHKLADVNAAREALEKEAERLGEKLAESEGALLRVQEELEQTKKLSGDTDANVAALNAKIHKLDDTVAEREAQAQEAKDALVAMQGEMEEQRKKLTEHYEQRLKALAQHNPSAATDALAERDAYKQRLAETEAWVQQAQLHLEALRTERDQLAAQATALANDMHARGAEASELYAQLSSAKDAVQQLTGRAAGLEQELLVSKQQTQRAQQQAQEAQQQTQEAQQTAQQALARTQTASGIDPAQYNKAQDEARVLRVQLQQAQQAAQQAQAAAAEAQRAAQSGSNVRPAMASGPDQAAFAQAQEELRALRQQLQQAQLAIAAGGGGGGGGRLPEEIEPLRWTLTAAIEAITTLEGREPSLGAHLRNLRLLASTLQKLSPSSN